MLTVRPLLFCSTSTLGFQELPGAERRRMRVESHDDWTVETVWVQAPWKELDWNVDGD